MLEIDDLSKRYGAVVALDGASFTAQPGPARRLPGAERRGQDDDDALHLRAGPPGPRRRSAGTAGRSTRQPGSASATCPSSAGCTRGCGSASSSSYFGQQHGLSRRRANAADARWLERFGLADRAKSKLEELSHGNQQRVQLATALVHDPELLVLDEPFSGLDPIGIATMAEVLRERAAAGVGVVFSSHQLDLVEDVCEDVVIIGRGRIVAAGAIDDLKAALGPAPPRGRGRRLGGAWLDGRPDLTVLERDGDRVRLLVDDGRPRRRCLPRPRPRARSAGSRYQPPKLSELFMEAVDAPQPAPAVRGVA